MPTRVVPRTFLVDLVALVVAAAVVFLGIALVIHLYLQGPFAEALSYYSDERPTADLIESLGGPSAAVTLVGVHVFADFLVPSYWAGLAMPWLQDQTGTGGVPAVNYLPTALLPFEVLRWLPYRVALTAYLGAMALALAAPMWFATKGRRWSVRILAVAVLGVAAGPSLAALDRGNLQGFVPVLVFGFAVAVLRNRWGWAAAFLVLAASLKIVPLVLVLVLIAVRQWKWAAVTVGATVALALVSFPIVSADGWSSIGALAGDVLAYRGSDMAGVLSHTATFAGGMGQAFLLVGVPEAAAWVSTHAGIIGAAYLLAVAPLLWASTLDLWVRLIIAMTLMTGVPALAFPYSASWVVAASALAVLMSPGGRWTGARSPRLPRGQWVPLMAALVLLTVPYAIYVPRSYEAGVPSGLLSLAVAGVSVLLPASMWWSVFSARRTVDTART